MSILPENKLKEFNKTPRIYFVYGGSMSGKTYFGRQFPNPLLLNTDGNGLKVDTPSIQITDYNHFIKVISEIRNGNHTFETIIIDLVEDIETMLVLNVCKKLNIDTLADAPYGQGYSKFKDEWKKMVLGLSKLPYNIIFISHAVEVLENNKTTFIPALGSRSLNIALGRCDLQLFTNKVGSDYYVFCKSKRDNYTEEDIKNENILKILKNVRNLFDSKR